HPAYSPDLAPTDFYLFQSLQHHLCNTHFKTIEEVKKCINELIGVENAIANISFAMKSIRSSKGEPKLQKIMDTILMAKFVLPDA
ncbi:hypothetical protein WH47_12001, partial [Habropoda laboriosa]